MPLRTLLLLGAALACLSAGHAAAAPLKVGSGNEAVIAPPVPHPDETPCIVKLNTDAKFGADGVPFTYTPPTACPGPWAKVVLNLDLSLNQGRQFDRTGLLTLAGVPLWFGTTAEPRATLSPKWHVEKDVTDYTALYNAPQTGVLQIANYQSSVYTSTITASTFLQFYPVTTTAPAPVTADVVLPLPNGGGTAGLGSSTDQAVLSGTLPTNILHASLQLYLQSQGGDEFWYFCVPNDVANELVSCGGTGFREGEITVDGTAAGVAPVYPWIYTGGIDPYLWQPIPGVQTFDFVPFHADLSPFAGVLSNGASHSIAVSVHNTIGSFSVTGALLLFLDHGATTVTGGITRNTLTPVAETTVENLSTAPDGTITGTVQTDSSRSFTIAGTVTGSAGKFVNTLTQTDDFTSKGRFDVNGPPQDFQTVKQTTDTTIVSSTKGPTFDNVQTQTLHYPLYITYNYKTAKSGNATQIVNVDQQYIESLLQQAGGTPTAQDGTTNGIVSSDELFFSAAGSVTGHKSQSETAVFTRAGTTVPCFKRKLVATYNVLTTVQTGC